MNQLNLKLTGEKYLDNAYISIDGKRVKFKKNEFGNIECKYQSDQDKAKIEIYKYPDVGGVWWFLIQLFFFVLSIFGIFDMHSRNRYLGMHYCAEISLKEITNVILRVNLLDNPDKAVDVETDVEVKVYTNVSLCSEDSKKVYKRLRIAKILLTLAIIALVTVIIIFILRR